MLSKISMGLVLVCLLGVECGLAQDPLKSAPTHYKLAFENEHVQVLYIHYGPHEKSAMHAHPAGVVVNLTNGHLKFIDQSGKAQEVSALHGEARWFPPFKHQVENLSSTSYDGIYIAIKSATSAAAGSGQNGLSKEDMAAISPFLLLANRQESQELPGPSSVKPTSSTSSSSSREKDSLH